MRPIHIFSLRSRTTTLQSTATPTFDEVPEKPVASAQRAPRVSLRDSSISLIKNCVGAGVFSINSKVLDISMNPRTYAIAAAIVVTMAAWSTYNFYILGETCDITESKTFGEAWEKTVSQNTRWIVQMIITIAPMLSSVANTIVLSEVMKVLLRTIGIPATVYENRNLVIFILSAVVLYPISILKNLNALKSVSKFGLIGHCTAMLALAIRNFDKTYILGGKFFATSVLNKPARFVPSASAGVSAASMSKWVMLASFLSYCFTAHYNVSSWY